MRFCGTFLLLGLAAAAAAQQPPPSTLASGLDREISAAEKQLVEAAEAMPEPRYGFSPEALGIAGADYKSVRTFAQQVKHVAASNYAIWSGVAGEKIPDDWRGGNGPDSVKTKAEILDFLKNSFALGHRAAATLTNDNAREPAVPGGKSSRLHLVVFGVSHAYDHYGQMVEYLRMNGIVPPASRSSAP
jgi:hypothetical protein